MIRSLALLVMLSACGANGSGNGYHEVDVHTVQLGVWHCVPVTGREGEYFPCHETKAECQETRYRALAHKLPKVGKCERHPSAVCYVATDTSAGITERDCARTLQTCNASHKRAIKKKYKVTECKPSK